MQLMRNRQAQYRRFVTALAFVLAMGLAEPTGYAQQTRSSAWHAASAAQLASVLPARAPVVTERIETDMGSASGITNGHQYVASVVLITAGYSAEGKYSHFFLTQVPIQLGKSLHLVPGDYVLGYQRGEDDVRVHFYDAATGRAVGTVTAHRMRSGFRVESFRIWPPADHSFIQIGRFSISYRIGG